MSYYGSYAILNPINTPNYFSGDHKTGHIWSPSYPNNYPNNIHCVWVLNLHPGTKARITFESFNLGEDFVQYDAVVGHPIPSFLHSNIHSSIHPIFFLFIHSSIHSLIRHSFIYSFIHLFIIQIFIYLFSHSFSHPVIDSSIHPSFIHPSIHSVCHSISHPFLHHPSVYYLAIYTNLCFFITLEKDYDTFEARDGKRQYNSRLTPFFGFSGTSYSTLTASTNAMWLKFYADDSVNKPGFKLRYDAIGQ